MLSGIEIFKFFVSDHLKAEIIFNMKCPYNYKDFFLTDAHPKFVYKLDIGNYKTVSNEKDMNNLFN